MSSLRFSPFLVALFATQAHAAESDPGLASSLGQMVLGLAVVVGLLLGTLWLIKRLSTPRGAAAGLKVLGAIPVGQRERVVLVEVADKVLVLGVTTANIRTLHTVDASEIQTIASPAPGAGMGGEFAGWLRQSLERRNNGR